VFARLLVEDQGGARTTRTTPTRTTRQELSVVGLGCDNFGMKLDHPASAALLNAALESSRAARRACAG
jgi:hypothetical protein